jgi:hypothetical protein
MDHIVIVDGCVTNAAFINGTEVFGAFAVNRVMAVYGYNKDEATEYLKELANIAEFRITMQSIGANLRSRTVILNNWA